MSNQVIVAILNDDNEVTEQQTIHFDDFQFEVVDSEERGMGASITHELSFKTDEFSIKNTIWEYPQGCFNDHSGWAIESGNVEIKEDTINYQNLFIDTDRDLDEDF